MTMRATNRMVFYVSDQAVEISIRLRDERERQRAKAFLNELLGFPHGTAEIEATLPRATADAYFVDSKQLKSFQNFLKGK